VLDLKRLFIDPDIVGLPPASVHTLLNPQTPSELAKGLFQVAKEALDTLIVYYAGHGMKAQAASGLYLATRETTEQACEFDGLPFETFRRAVASSPARKKILILDCCFSGEALEDGMGSEAALLAAGIELKGTFSIASSPATKLSVAPLGDRYTAFTGELITILRDGIDGDDQFLTLDHVYQELRRRLLQTGLPEPQCQSRLDGSRLKIARNQGIVLDLRANLSAIQTRLDANKGQHFEFETFQKIEQYLFAVKQSGDFQNLLVDPRYLVLKRYSTNEATVEQVVKAFWIGQIKPETVSRDTPEVAPPRVPEDKGQSTQPRSVHIQPPEPKSPQLVLALAEISLGVLLLAAAAWGVALGSATPFVLAILFVAAVVIAYNVGPTPQR